MKNVARLIVLLVLWSAAASGQTPFFQQYYPLKKSEPVEVNDVFQDRKGYLWLGTDKGLFRFDGTRYQRYADADTLRNIEITAVAEDSLGRIWAGHRSGELSFLEDGKLRLFSADEGFATAPISDILFDAKGVMWFSTMNDGLYYYVGDRLYRVDEQEGLPDLFIYDLHQDAAGRIWAGTDGGIAICSLHDRAVSVEVLDSDDGLPDIIIKKIRAARGDSVLLATEDAGILSYDPHTRSFSPLGGAWKYGSVSDFVVKNGQVWISCPRKGLVVYDGHTRRYKSWDRYAMATLRSVNSLMLDREGNIWIASRTGLTRTLGDAVEHLQALEPLRDMNVLALAVDREDRIWFSTSEGLFMHTPGNSASSPVVSILGGTPFGRSTVISLYVDARGYVWAGLYGEGALEIDPRTNAVRHFRKELRNGNVLHITGSGNTIWLATLGGSTSIQVGSDGTCEVSNFSSEDGLSSDYIYQVFVDSRSRTWFTTDGRGVCMKDAAGFHQFSAGLGSRVVYSITEDADGDIWVSSQDNGLYVFRDGKFVQVPGIRLRDQSVQSLASDAAGNIVAVHNFGIDVFNRRSMKMDYWGEEAGIQDKHPNLNAVAKDQHGQLYFGTSRGIVKFSLHNEFAGAAPKPAIDAVAVYGEHIDLDGPKRLRHNENNLTIHYLGFWYRNVESLYFQYKLDNYDLEWIGTRDQDVTYSRLPAGEYTFRVRVSGTDDFTGAPEVAFRFSIAPPFWRTGPFYFLVAGLFLITTYGIIRFRERKLLEAKMILEARVDERTREIQLKTEEIQAQNEEILAQAEEIQGINENLEMLVKKRTAELEKKNKALEEYAFINAHKLRGPVASILGLLNLLSKPGVSEREAKTIRDHLQQSADKLDDVVRSITKAIEKADNEYL